MSSQPTTIGRYEILGAIGRGGMGALFLALDPKLDRQLAIKLLRDDDDDLRERFAREARAAARLRHPNIVTIFDVGEHDGQPFIAMEYIQGQTLAEVVRGNVAMPLVRKLELMEALCDGLGFAHRRGIIHRDVKPANLMIDADGSLKILDFGIARAAESSSMTQAGMLIGTLNYMSPEQVSGQSVDLRSDLFAVGAVFYELLSYRQAFPGGLMAGILNKILSGQPEPLPAIVQDIDADIVRIVECALEKEPDRRYPDLAAMRQDIAQARLRLSTSESSRVLGVAPETGGTGEPRPTPSPSSGSRRKADLEGLARRRAEQIQVHLAAAEARLAEHDGEGAIAAAEQVLLLDPDQAPAHSLVERARALIDAQQVEAALDAASGGIASGDFAAVTSLLARAAEIDPSEPRLADVRRAFEDAVARQEEARQREALEARVREVIAGAEQQFASGRRDDGVATLAAFQPGHPLVAQTLERLRAEAVRLAEEERAAAERAERQAAEAADRARRDAEVRAARERARAAADAIKAARRTKGGPEAAMAVLRPALARDPDNADLLVAFTAYEADAQRAAAHAAAEASRQQIEEETRRQAEAQARTHADEAARHQAAAAAAAAEAQQPADSPDVATDDRTILLRREVPPPVASTPAPVQEQPTMAVPQPALPTTAPSKASRARESGPSSGPSRPASAMAGAALTDAFADTHATGSGAGGLSHTIKYGGAAALVVVAILAFVLLGGGAGETPTVDDTPAPPDVTAGNLSVQGVDSNPAGTAESPAGSPAEPEPAPSASVPSPVADVPPQAPPQRPSEMSAQDRRLDDLFADAERLRDGGDLRSAIERIEAGVKMRAGDTRFGNLAAAIRQDAERRATAARGQAQGIGPPATSLASFLDAENVLAQARQQASAVESAQLFLTAEARFGTATTDGRRAAEDLRRQQEQDAARQRDADRQNSQQVVVDTRQADESAIRQVVDRYRQGYNSLDVDAVVRVFPSVNAPALRKAFAGYASQSMTLGAITVALDGSGATVRAQMVHAVQPRSGSRQESRTAITLTLRKNGNAWIITDRR
ncbi:MAG: hypothetical protein ABS36_16145 [Acidobacteria bacterium SCN 69-37]|nr:MAG: hypothetical protein ABS36_16145 [Acidobacteria bacterium SCN 69-37]